MNISKLIEELVFIINDKGDKCEVTTLSKTLFVTDDKGNVVYVVLI